MPNLFDAAKTVSALAVAEKFAGVQAKRIGKKAWCRCPLPRHPADNTPSCSFDEKGRFYCFGCNESGSSIDMTMKLFDLTAREAALRICTDFGVEHINTRPVWIDRSKVTQAEADELLLRFDNAACGMLRLIECIVVQLQPTPDDDFSDEFVDALDARTWLNDIVIRIQEARNTGNQKAGLELVEAHEKNLLKWESILANQKKEKVEP